MTINHFNKNISETEYFSNSNEIQNQDEEYSNKDTDKYELTISSIHFFNSFNRRTE